MRTESPDLLKREAYALLIITWAYVVRELFSLGTDCLIICQGFRLHRPTHLDNRFIRHKTHSQRHPLKTIMNAILYVKQM